MKRPHRRLHFLIWLIVTPLTLIAGIYAWMQRPQTPYTEIPNSIERLDVTSE